MATFIEKPRDRVTLDAVLFLRDDSPVQANEKFYGLNVCVDSRSAYVMVGSEVCRSGNYVVLSNGKASKVMSAEEIQQHYEPVEPKVAVVETPVAEERLVPRRTKK